MPDRNAQLKVVISGDTKGLDRATRSASNSLGKLGKETTLHARVTSKGFAGIGLAARGAAAGFGAATLAGGYLVKQYTESAKVSAQTQAVLKSTGGAANVSAKHVSDLATAISRKTGIDDEAIQSGENLLLTFRDIHNETGKGNKIFDQATKSVTDMSAALGQDTKSSAIQLGKALNDPIKGVTALQRVGVSFTDKQKEQIKTLVDSGKKMDAQKLILKELKKEFGGSAAAIASPFDKLKVSVGNLAESLGGALAPMLGKAADWLTKFLNQMQDGKGAGGKFVAVVKDIAHWLKTAWHDAVTAVSGFLKRHRDDIANVRDFVSSVVKAVGRFIGRIPGYWQDMTSAVRGFIHRNQDTIDALRQAVVNVSKAIKAVIEKVLIPAVKALIPAIKGIVGGVIDVLGGLIKFVSNVLSGRWGKAWDGIKDIVKGAFKIITNTIKGFVSVALSLAKSIGGAIVKGILAGLSGLAKALADKVKSAVSSIPGAISGAAKSVGKALISPFGDGVGKAYASSQLPIGVTGGAFSGSLMGARPVMGTFAREGARFGLGVSSGRRAGSITSSGNLSWHSTGEAIDLSNGYATPQELAFARYEASHHGGQLAELIHTPLGFGIKDGRRVPLSFWGPTINAQHMNHVHVAYDSGRPGIGDGIGQIENLWMQAGGPRSRAAIAAAVAEAESSGNPEASNRNSDGSIDRGLWQINSVHGALSTFDRMGNARAAVRISSGGSNWRPWTTYVSGAYRRFLGPAQAALAGVKGKGGSGGSVTDPRTGGALAGDQSRVAGSRSTGNAMSRAIGNALRNDQSNVASAKAAQHYGNLVGDLNLPVRLRGSDTDILDAADALAQGTKGTADDIAAANAAVRYWKAQLKKARKSGKASKIVAARAGLSSAQGRLSDLKTPVDTGDSGGADDSALIDAINANTEAQQQAAALEQQRIDLETQMTANQTKLIMLAQTQGPNLLSAVVAAVSGDIGGRIGLGFQTPGFAGGVART